MVTTLDPYATLGIPVTASRSEAARAHRRLAKRYHPDVNRGGGAAERMRHINEAWRILSDPARRSLYDASRRSAAWTGAGAATRGTRSTWTAWPDSRWTTARRARRPVRQEPIEPSFGDHPAVVFTVGAGLALFVFIGTWLGSLVR